MKATGIVRRVDDLGRVVIPKEIRRIFRIREGDSLEIYTGYDGAVIFKKYSLLAELKDISSKYAEALHKTGGYPVLVCDLDKVIAVAGISKKELLERRISPDLQRCMARRKSLPAHAGTVTKINPVEGDACIALAGAPIITAGDVCGYILFISEDHTACADSSDIKLVTAASAFLGKYMEN